MLFCLNCYGFTLKLATFKLACVTYVRNSSPTSLLICVCYCTIFQLHFSCTLRSTNVNETMTVSGVDNVKQTEQNWVPYFAHLIHASTDAVSACLFQCFHGSKRTLQQVDVAVATQYVDVDSFVRLKWSGDAASKWHFNIRIELQPTFATTHVAVAQYACTRARQAFH